MGAAGKSMDTQPDDTGLIGPDVEAPVDESQLSWREKRRLRKERRQLEKAKRKKRIKRRKKEKEVVYDL